MSATKRTGISLLLALIMLMSCAMPLALAAPPAALYVEEVDTDDLDEIDIEFSRKILRSSVKRSCFKIGGEPLQTTDRVKIDDDDDEIQITRPGGFVGKRGETLKLEISGIQDRNGQTMTAYSATIRFDDDDDDDDSYKTLRVKEVDTDDLDEIDIEFSRKILRSSVKRSCFKIGGEPLQATDRVKIDDDDDEIKITRPGGFVSESGKTIKLEISGLQDRNGKTMTAYTGLARFEDDDDDDSYKTLRVKEVDTDDLDEIDIEFSRKVLRASVKRSCFKIGGEPLRDTDKIRIDDDDDEIKITRPGGFVKSEGQTLKLEISGIQDRNGKTMTAYSATIRFDD